MRFLIGTVEEAKQVIPTLSNEVVATELSEKGISQNRPL